MISNNFVQPDPSCAMIFSLRARFCFVVFLTRVFERLSQETFMFISCVLRFRDLEILLRSMTRKEGYDHSDKVRKQFGNAYQICEILYKI